MTRILIILHVYSLSQANKEETVPVLSAALEMIHCSFFQPEKKNVTTVNINKSTFEHSTKCTAPS